MRPPSGFTLNTGSVNIVGGTIATNTARRRSSR
jgi:hypothetical protein